jgi:hypothetical protein
MWSTATPEKPRWRVHGDDVGLLPRWMACSGRWPRNPTFPLTIMRTSVKTTLTVLAALVALGTSYSQYYQTFLDTSDPSITSLPHPLHDTHFFASKQNPLNTLFLKRLWFWTSAAFIGLFLTSPGSARNKERLYQYGAATAVWALFTSWFFGPALIERVVGFTGGECVVTLPSGYVLKLPDQYCYTSGAVSPATHPTLFAASLLVPETASWSARPRLRRGHDVSGHIFLITMSALFLVDQLAKSRGAGREAWPSSHRWAVLGTWAVVALEMFASYVTSVYFHLPQEKFTGFRMFFQSVMRHYIILTPVLFSIRSCRILHYPATFLPDYDTIQP